MNDNSEQYFIQLKQALKDGERAVTGYTGKTPNDSLEDLTDGLPAGQIWVRINGQSDPYNALYEDASVKQPNLPVKLIFDFEADGWVIKSINASLAIYDAGGTSAPVFAVYPHDHLTDSTGGNLGAGSVGNTQLQALSVAEGNIQDSAVTDSKVASGIDGDKLLTGSMNADRITSGTITSTQIADNAVPPTKTDGLTGSSTAYVIQTASDGFEEILYNHSASSAPTSGDDTNDNYKIGSSWIDTTSDRGYKALDVTASNAVWKEITNPVYFFLKNDDTGNTTTSGTTTLTAFDYTITASGFDPTKRFLINVKSPVEGTTVNDVYAIAMQYNYDNAGSEDYIGFTSRVRIAIVTTNTLDYKLFTDIYDGASFANTWGYSGAYKVRCRITRVTGTGTMTWDLSLTTLQVIEI